MNRSDLKIKRGRQGGRKGGGKTRIEKLILGGFKLMFIARQ